MNKLPLGALAAFAATQLAGCIISSDNHNDEAYITVNWQIKNVGSTELATCPPDHDTVAFYSQEVDANGDAVGQQFVDLFPCSAGTAESAPLPPSTYVSWIEITNSNNTSTFAKSLGQYVDVTVQDKSFDETIYIDGGYIQVDWNLADANTRLPLSCEQTQSVTEIAIQASYSNPTDLFERKYPCEDYTAITDALVARTYTVVLEPTNALDEKLGEVVEIPNVQVFSQNHLNHLEPPVTLFIY